MDRSRERLFLLLMSLVWTWVLGTEDGYKVVKVQKRLPLIYYVYLCLYLR